MIRATLVLLTVLLVGGCSIFGGAAEDPLPGKRIAVLEQERTVRPDPVLADFQVYLPPPQVNVEWPQNGGNASHAMHHLALEDPLYTAWERDVGTDADDERRLLAPPVVARNRVFAIDAAHRVSAVDVESGKRVWRKSLKPPEEDTAGMDGGLAYADNRVFATMGFAELIALDAGDGSLLWRRRISGPSHTPPAVYGGRVVVLTIDNTVQVFDVQDGRELWQHSGLAETAGLLGGATPAADADVVIVPYSSGEVFALRVANGRALWSDNLATLPRLDPISQIADIRGYPVIDRDRVYVISNAGRTVAIDIRTGARIWDRDFGGIHGPWIAGDFLYVLTGNAELVCMLREDGRVRWAVQLPRFVDPRTRKKRIVWHGPVLAGDRLIVGSSRGTALAVSPYDGRLLGELSLPGPVSQAPVVAGKTVYFFTDDAEIVALR